MFGDDSNDDSVIRIMMAIMVVMIMMVAMVTMVIMTVAMAAHCHRHNHHDHHRCHHYHHNHNAIIILITQNIVDNGTAKYSGLWDHWSQKMFEVGRIKMEVKKS
jgi:sensor domain CHASE-containing protein